MKTKKHTRRNYRKSKKRVRRTSRDKRYRKMTIRTKRRRRYRKKSLKGGMFRFLRNIRAGSVPPEGEQVPPVGKQVPPVVEKIPDNQTNIISGLKRLYSRLTFEKFNKQIARFGIELTEGEYNILTGNSESDESTYIRTLEKLSYASCPEQVNTPIASEFAEHATSPDTMIWLIRGHSRIQDVSELVEMNATGKTNSYLIQFSELGSPITNGSLYAIKSDNTLVPTEQLILDLPKPGVIFQIPRNVETIDERVTCLPSLTIPVYNRRENTILSACPRIYGANFPKVEIHFTPAPLVDLYGHKQGIFVCGNIQTLLDGITAYSGRYVSELKPLFTAIDTNMIDIPKAGWHFITMASTDILHLEHFMNFVQTFAKHTVFTIGCKSYRGQQDISVVRRYEAQQIPFAPVVIDGVETVVVPVGRHSTQVSE